MATKWIDFKALKEQVRIRDVLTHYGLLDHLAEKKPGKLVGPCPLHGGKNGTSFHVDCEKNIWHCFSECGGGNVIDLVMKLEHVSIRDAGVKLATRFDLDFDRPTKRDEAKVPSSKKTANVSQEKSTGTTADRPTEPTINPPLGRELKLDHEHAYLWVRGLTAPTVKTFGVGFCTRGIMKNRIAIPIENDHGELVAYAGRAVDDELAKEEGKYKLPAGFQKSHVVYNLSRAREHAGNGLIVVEGFFDAMKVHQAGFPNVVALMGSQLSAPQAELLVSATDRLVLMFDGDDAGVTCTREFYKRLRRRVFLKEVALEPGQQPDALEASTLKTLLGGERR